VVNFGKLTGPVAAAFLMALWCVFLARLDLTGNDFGRLLIYMVGIITIFNFGRDISLAMAYPALFGFALLCFWRKIFPHISAIKQNTSMSNRKSRRKSTNWNNHSLNNSAPYSVTVEGKTQAPKVES